MRVAGKKQPTAGWEYERLGSLRAAKFCVHEGKGDSRRIVWAACAVYDADFPKEQAFGFIEKLTFLTEAMRSTPEWREGGLMSQQATFGPMLQQRMEQANSGGKAAMISDQVGEVKELMNENIELMLENQDNLEELRDKSDAMAAASKQFHKGARRVKRFKMTQQAKLGAAAGLAVTAGVAVVTVPIVMAATL